MSAAKKIRDFEEESKQLRAKIKVLEKEQPDDPFVVANLFSNIRKNDPEFDAHITQTIYARETASRMRNILAGEFAKSLGEPTDFRGHDRILFSLDNSASNIVNESTLPKILSLIEDIVGSKIDFRICQGAYRYENGLFCVEVSFLVKCDSSDLKSNLIQYIRHNTRQESILRINKNEGAILEKLHVTEKTRKTSDGQQKLNELLGIWTPCSEEKAMTSSAFTQIGSNWFICDRRAAMPAGT